MTASFPVIHMQSGKIRPHELVVFGERNSGTNLAHALLTQNLPDFANSPGDRIGKFGFRYGWKHGFPQMLAAPDTTLAICLFRHPETWLRSMHARPWHAVPALQDQPFDQFIRSQWQTRVDERNFGLTDTDPRALAELQWDRHPLTGKRFESILALRTAKTAGFMSLKNRFTNCLLLRHEDITAAPEDFVSYVAVQYGLTQQDHFQPVTDRRGRATEGPFTPTQYAPLTPQDRDFVWSTLDTDQEKILGYQRLT